jgi:integrase
MYQYKLSLLNDTDASAPRVHSTTPPLSTAPAIATDDDTRIRIRPARPIPTYARTRRREANVALARQILDNSSDVTGLNLEESGSRFEEHVMGSRIETLFSASLPIGLEYAIPVGTGSLDCTEDDRMNEQNTLVDAIDAGCTDIGHLNPQVAYFLRNSRAPSTRRLYHWAWSRVLRSCNAMDHCPLPMSEATAAMVLVDAINDGLAIGSMKILASVISVAHGLAKQPDPTETEAVRSVVRGMSRVLTTQQDQKVALDPDELRRIRDACAADPNSARGIRDWGLIAFGFAGAFRRSEMVSRNVADLDFVGNELRVYLDRSKTDQFGRGAYVTIKAAKDERLCPIRAIRAWLEIAPGPGPLFRGVTKHSRVLPRRLSAGSVSQIVKGFGVVLDLPEDRLGAHSLRAGMVTALLESGLPDALTMEHSRHKDHDTMSRYYRPRRPTVNYTELAGL